MKKVMHVAFCYFILCYYEFAYYYYYYLGDQLSDDETDKLLNRRSFKPKPIIISLDVNKDGKYWYCVL